MPNDDIKEAEAALQLAEEAPRLDAIAEQFQNAFHKDRSLIGKWIVRMYCLVVGADMLFLMVKGTLTTEPVIAAISDLIKVAVLPIITLVLGFYFGRDRS